MRYWVSTVFAWKYWAAFFVLAAVIAWYLIRLFIVLVFLCCEWIGYWWIG